MKDTRKISLPAFVMCIVLGIVSIQGCESNIGLDYPPHNPELAVFCIFNPEDPWAIVVRKTGSLGDPISEETTRFIDNARVEILSGDQVIATALHAGQGTYLARDDYPRAGIEYTLRVSVPDFPGVTAVNSIPEFVGTPTVVFTDSTGFEASRSAVQSELRLSFNDPADQTNFYAIEALADYGAGIRETIYSSSNPVLRSTSFINIFGKVNEQETVFDDATFNGGTFDASILVDRVFVDAYRADLLHVSEAYYRYALSLVQIENAGDNPFSEPVRPYSNVTGGQGVFAGFLRHPTTPVQLNEIDINVVAGEYRAFVFHFQNDSLRSVKQVQADSLLEKNMRFEFFADGTMTGRMVLDKSHNRDDPSNVLDLRIKGTFSYDKPYVFISMEPAFFEEPVWIFEQDGMKPLNTDVEYFAFFSKRQQN